MRMILIYSCCFVQENYIDLVELLLKTYAFYGNVNESENVKYLILCDVNFVPKIKKIYEMMGIDGDIWAITNIATKFDSAYIRLKIFDYKDIDEYSKILYLDCDILITNDLSNLLNLSLENKLYAQKEGNTSNDWWGAKLWVGQQNPNKKAFSTGVLYFNNCDEIKALFRQILNHIYKHNEARRPIPICLEQPFVIYHAINNDCYNNELLNSFILLINSKNKIEIYKKQCITHFPGGDITFENGKISGGPGNYERKYWFMHTYLNYRLTYMDNDETFNILEKKYKHLTPKMKDKIFHWRKAFIKFKDDYNLHGFAIGRYVFLNPKYLMTKFGSREHILKFNDAYTKFLSMRTYDFEIVNGTLFDENKSNIKDVIKYGLFDTQLSPLDTLKINSKSSKIPTELIICESFSDYGSAKILSKLKEYTPSFTINFFDIEKQKTYILNNLDYLERLSTYINQDINLFETYKKINDRQYQRLFFILVYLYKHGGVYIDTQTMLNTNIHNILQNYDLTLINAWFAIEDPCVLQAFIATIPEKDLILEYLIYLCTRIFQIKSEYVFKYWWGQIYKKYKTDRIQLLEEINKMYTKIKGNIILDPTLKHKLLTTYTLENKINEDDI